MKFLPNKKVAIIFSAVFALVAVIFVFVRNTRDGARHAVVQSLDTQGALAPFSTNTIDTDGDGLKDWEEALWKTDPNNADTDRDGTTDGEEVRANRDPNVAGPNDSISTATTTMSKEDELESILSEGKKIPKQDIVIRKFFAQYLSLRQKSGAKLSRRDKDNLINSFINDSHTDSYKDKYTIDDVNVVKDNSTLALRLYADTMGGVLARASVPLREHELVIFQRALKSGREEYLRQLDDVVVSYDVMARAGALVKVPSSLEGLHLDLLNDLERASIALKNMQLVFSNPILGSSAAKVFDNMSSRIADTFNLFVIELNRRGVALTKGEPGYIFVSAQL